MAEKSPIVVQPCPQFLGDHEGKYAFAYTVKIVNQGAEPAQLLSRHWVITDGAGQTKEVHGDGVIGEQPRLLPGQSFIYTSGAIIPTRVGSMRGTYHFVTDTGKAFDTEIPEFALVAPNALH